MRLELWKRTVLIVHAKILGYLLNRIPLCEHLQNFPLPVGQMLGML